MTSGMSRVVSAASLAVLLAAGGLAVNFSPSASVQPPASDRPTQPPDRRPERGPGREGGPEGRGGQGASVEAGMKMMNRAARQLGGQIADAAKKDENLKLINDIQRGCATAKGAGVPADVLSKAKDDAEKAKLAKAFRTDLIKVLRAAIELEELVADGKTAEAKTKFDEVVKMQDAGHAAMGLKE